MNKKRIASFITCALMTLLLLSCSWLFSKLDNPVDPDAKHYQGYPTVTEPNDLTIVSPANGNTLTGTTLIVSEVFSATAYHVRIAESKDSLGTTNLYEKSDNTTNEMDISTAPLLNGTTYYWQARANKDGLWGKWTPAASFYTGWTTPAKTPTFDPPGGTYSSDQSVSISCTTSGATIYYTIDGSTPTTSSPQYSGPISVAGEGTTMTIKAIAAKTGYALSAAGSATYRISYDAVATPTFDPPSGTYTSDQSVSISCTTSGATIYYTIDGSTPTTSSPQYSGPISVAGDGTTMTIKAIAAKTGYTASNVASATYRISYTVQISLVEAVDNTSLSWRTGGDADWAGQTNTSYYGGDAAQSGIITNGQTTYIQTTITGPCTVTFYWKVSSESGYDFLRFYVDGIEQENPISGEVDWQQKSHTISSGNHTLKWSYEKDGSVSTGSDSAWLDFVSAVYESPVAVNTKGWTKLLFGGAGPQYNGNMSYYPWASSQPPGIVTARWIKNHGNEAQVRTGDINGDGYLEIVTLVYQGSNKPILKIYERNGNVLLSQTVPVSSTYEHWDNITLADINGDNIPEIFVPYRDTSDNLKCDIYDGSGNLLKTINRGASGYDSSWSLAAAKGDKLFFFCNAGYSLSPRGLSVCSYSSANELLNYFIGPAGWGQYSMALVDTNGNGTVEIALPTGTPHNGASANGTTDGELWAVVLNENGTALFKTNNLAGRTGVDGALWPIITDIDDDEYHDEIIYFESHDPTYYPGVNRIHIFNTAGTIVTTINGPTNGDTWYTAIGHYNTPTYDIFASALNEEKIYVFGALIGSTNVSLLAQSAPGAGRILAVNDIDGNGQDDIIVYQSSTSKIRVLRNDFTELFSYTVGGSFGSSSGFAISDIDNDGRNEILYSNNTTFYVIGAQ